MAAESSGTEIKTPAQKTDIFAANMPASASCSSKMKFGVLIGLIEVGEISNRDVVDTVLNLLVGGEFDLESNFVIEEPENINYLLELLDHCSVTLQAEIWSMFVAILRKSVLNLQACTEVGLMAKLIHKLRDCDEMISDLLMEILGVCASYSISVKELKLIFSFLKGDESKWPPYSVKLLQVLRQMPKKHGPDAFFSFPGKNAAIAGSPASPGSPGAGTGGDNVGYRLHSNPSQAIALPPMARWPYQNGFTLSTWFRIDPVNVNIERDKPYLYCFRTSKGIGYSGHFMGSCLVITAVKIKGKGFQHCIKYDFQPRKWYMVTAVHIYNRWRASEIRCYVNGDLVSSGEMQWYVNTNDPFDKCFLGSAPTADKERTFCGQMASMYLFSEALNTQQVHAINLLGPNYKSHFKFPSESDVSLPDGYKKILYDGKLTNAIVFLYNPAATESQLCLESSPKGNISYFVHSPHALMVQDVRAIVTHSIHSTLHSIGGIHMIFPLLTQLDYVQQNAVANGGGEEKIDPVVCPLLLGLLCDLLKGSVSTQQQMVQGRGFVILGYLLQKAATNCMTETVLELFLDLAKHFNSAPAGTQLLRHLVDHILFNPALWIHTPVKVQISLYTFLANEFVGQSSIYTNIRRVSTVLQLMHTLKYYYWIVNPEDRSGVTPKGLDGPRPSDDDLTSLRALILRITKQLILKEKSANDEELQIILNYLMTMHEDVNLRDVLQLLLALMAENVNGLAVAFDRKNGVRVVYKLLASADESVCAMALKVLSLFLSRLPHKRKMDLMYGSNLYSLLGERLQLNSESLSLTMYNCMFELLTERVSLQISNTRHAEPDKTYRVMNPGMFHVIAKLLRQSTSSDQLMEVKRLFLSDMILLFNHSRENRRILLQCSVWQDWMISLAYIYPKTDEEKKITEMVYSLLRMLLHHAMKYEWGGWRVWVDTLSIIHSKVSFEDHKVDLLKAYDRYQRRHGGNDGSPSSPPSLSAALDRNDLENAMLSDNSISALAAMTGGYMESEGLPDEYGNIPELDPDSLHRKREIDVRSFLDGIINDAVRIVEGEKKVDDGEEEEPTGDGEGKAEVETRKEVASVSKDTDEKPEREQDGKEPAEKETDQVTKPEAAAPDSKQPTVVTASASSNNQSEPQQYPKRPLSSSQWQEQQRLAAAAAAQGNPARFFSPGPHQAPYRIPEFCWSHMHQRMMSDLLFAIETDVQVWRSNTARTIIDYVNSAENTIFVQNVTQMVSQIMDNLIYSSGGILPMLSSATSRNDDIEHLGAHLLVFMQPNEPSPHVQTELHSEPESPDTDDNDDDDDNNEPDVIEATQGLPLDVGISFINRIMNLVDVLVFASNQTFAELEAEKNMPRGGILRQCLRLTAFSAIRNVLECRYRNQPTTTVSVNPYSIPGMITEPNTPSGKIQTLISATQPSPRYTQVKRASVQQNIVDHLGSPMNPVKDVGRLLQDMDIHRLRAVVYRDVEESKQAQFLALAIVYFISVLMVARYRDILDSESTSTPSRENSVRGSTRSAGSTSLASSKQSLASEATSAESKGTQTLKSRLAKQPIKEEVTCDPGPGKDGLGQGSTAQGEVPAKPEPAEQAVAEPSPDKEEQPSKPVPAEKEKVEEKEKEEDVPAEEKEDAEAPSTSQDEAEAEKEEAAEEEKDKDADDKKAEAKAKADEEEGTNVEAVEIEVDEDGEEKAKEPATEKPADDDKDKTRTEEKLEVVENGEESASTGDKEESTEDSEPTKQEAPDGKAEVDAGGDNGEKTVQMNGTGSMPTDSKPGAAQPSPSSEEGGKIVKKDDLALASASISSMVMQSDKVDKVPLQTWPWTATSDEKKKTNGSEDGSQTTNEAPSSDSYVPPPLTEGAVSKAGRPAALELLENSTLKQVPEAPGEIVTVEDRLTKALETAAPLLREIFLDFAPFLSKTLLGSHGQELLIEGLISMKSSNSVIELVMMLCSQEWQNSIQKHAGLAFIELVNEGRLYSHATRDHLLRVANEAEFILSRHRAEDVQKHAEFESLCAQSAMECKEEEKMCDHLITAARRRDHIFANQLLQKTINILTNKHGAWGNVIQRPREFYKVDMWEDNTRRHRRLVRNPYGSTHSEATLKAAIEHGEPEDVVEKAKQALHAQLATGRRADLQGPEIEEDSQSLQDEKDAELETELEGPVVYSTPCDLIAPCVICKGTLSITSSEMYFEVDEDDAEFKKLDSKVLCYTEGLHGRWHFNDIRAVFSRRYLLQNTALEIFLANRTSVMFNLPNKATVKKVVHTLPRVGVGLKYGIPPSRRVSLANAKQLFKSSNMTQAWQRREISNFEYLMYLNTVAGRTYNDLNQYPVFPWVITNYESAELDLTLPSNFRDLSKPIGALNPSRRAFFQERYETWDDEKIPPFHYGTHYSTLGFTLNWLMRLEPYTSFFLNMQGGKFDHASRSFSSIASSWKNCQRDTADVKELIPEFFYMPEMFINTNSYTLGKIDDGPEVDDVVLPQWAKSSEDFVRINRMALESEFVSCQLHQWIDLIFGYKQRGPEAVRATNVFYYLTYEGSVNLENIDDPVMKEAIAAQIRSFGQTPSQLLTEPHPPRSSAMHLSPMMYSDQLQQDVLMIIKFLSNSPVIHVSAHTHPAVPQPAVVTVACNQTFAMNKWNNQVAVPNFNQPGQPPNAGSPGYSMEAGKNLLIELDPLILSTTGMHRRQIVDTMDTNVKAQPSCYVVTADNRYIMACGFWDKSFRVFLTDTCKVTQVVYGHWDMCTCLARSECPVGGDCYIVSGSRDATLLVWHWSAKLQWVLGENHVHGETATPRAILTGHDTEVKCAAVCTELGLVASGSVGGACLIHTVSGDLLRSLDPPEPCQSPRLTTIAAEEGVIIVVFDKGHICSFTINGKFLKHTEIQGKVNAVKMKPEGDYFITGGDNRVVQVWRTHDHNLMYTFPLCDASILALDLAHEQRTIIAGMATGSIVAFHVNFFKWHHEYRDAY